MINYKLLKQNRQTVLKGGPYYNGGIQRLNYSKINEFQYQLSYDEENAIEIPLSINSISIKYKIGGQVR